MAGLGAARSRSGPRVSNDNPYSKARYKTMKYRPDHPGRFGSPRRARQWCERFFQRYHYEHRHSGIGYHTPYDVHHGKAGLVRDPRARVLADAYHQHPERFARKFPEPPALPEQAWVNKPADETAEQESQAQS